MKFRLPGLGGILTFALCAGCAQGFPISETQSEQALALMLLSNASRSSTVSCANASSCYIFATSGAWLGDLGGMPGITGADAQCMSDANKPSGGGTYKAMLVDGTTRIASVSANAGDGQVGWVLYASKQYVRPDGLPVMTTNANRIFVFGVLSNPIAASGTSHTGMLSTWTTSVHCNGWTDNTGGGQGRYGSNPATAGTSIGLTQTACDTTTRGLYCVQQ